MAFCTKCGTQVSEEIKFCTKCGNAMGAPNRHTAPAPTPASPRPLPQQQFSGASPQTKNKSPLPIIIGAAAVLILVTAGIFVFVKRGDQSAEKQPAPDTEQVSQAEDPAVALEKLRVGMRVNSIDELVPDGWRKITSASGVGDLNNDGYRDEVIVIEATAPANISGASNFNPRVLLAFLTDATNGSGSGYTLAGKSGIGFIPAQSSREKPCAADPLASGGIEITTRATFRVTLNHKHKLEANCPTLEGNNQHKFIFRYQNNQFELIGADYAMFDPEQYEQISVSINFSTKDIERKTPEGGTSKGKINIDRMYNLGNSHEAYNLLADAAAGKLSIQSPANRDLRLVGEWRDPTSGMSIQRVRVFRGDGSLYDLESWIVRGDMPSGGTDTSKGTWRTANNNTLTTTSREGTATVRYRITADGDRELLRIDGEDAEDAFWRMRK